MSEMNPSKKCLSFVNDPDAPDCCMGCGDAREAHLMNNPIASYSKEALLEELSRRERQRLERKKIKHWCDDCTNFKFVLPFEKVPDDHNCCEKGHAMKFRLPETAEGYGGGFYRHVCRDRQPRDVSSEAEGQCPSD